VGAGNGVTSRDLVIFADQATQPVPPKNAHTRHRTPAAVNTASKAAVNLASRSRIRNFRPSALQYGELMAQDQDFCGLPRILAPRQPQPPGNPGDQEKTRTAST